MGFINKLGQIAIPVKNIERATAFYKNMLGLPLLFNTDTMAFFDCDGVRLLLSLPEKDKFAHASSVLYFQVEDINRSFKEFQSKGVEFTDKPHLIAKMGSMETWMVFLKDTEGNMHALMSEIEV